MMDQSTNTKICTGCSEEKSFSEFGKKSTGRFGLNPRCKSCISERDRKARSRNNAARRKRYNTDEEYRQKVLSQNKKWTSNNLEHRLEYLTGWKKNNPEKMKKYWDTHYDKHKEKYLENGSTRDKRVKERTPAWANLEDIRKVYALAKKISKKTGVPHEVDHIIPLNGENVSGLHVFENLQIITKEENRSKSNKFDPNRKRDWE